MFTHNPFAYEIEVTHRRREYQRKAKAEALAAQASPAHGQMRRSHWQHSLRAWLHPPPAPRFAASPTPVRHCHGRGGTPRALASWQGHRHARPRGARTAARLVAGSGLRSLL
jgi:hypothetical protein